MIEEDPYVVCVATSFAGARIACTLKPAHLSQLANEKVLPIRIPGDEEKITGLPGNFYEGCMDQTI